jgi:transcriptional regulator with XRE-family HTH domain
MELKLSQKKIGRRITALRKVKGLSQEDLARQIDMSRPSLAQIELGNRGIDIFELHKLSLILEFSLDEFLSPDFELSNSVRFEKADLTQLSAAEKTVIDDVIRQMSDWNANKISEYSHRDKPWKATGEGDYISYNSVFYRRPPFSVREYPEDEQD